MDEKDEEVERPTWIKIVLLAVELWQIQTKPFNNLFSEAGSSQNNTNTTTFCCLSGTAMLDVFLQKVFVCIYV